MEKNTVKLARLRSTEYTVNFDTGIRKLEYKWAGCKKGGKPMVKEVPIEVFDYLNMTTSTLSSGALVIAEEEPKKEEFVELISEVEEYENNSHTHDEIVALLKGNMAKMKKELSAITSKQEKMFVKEIADEISSTEGLNNTKLEFIDKWFKDELE